MNTLANRIIRFLTVCAAAIASCTSIAAATQPQSESGLKGEVAANAKDPVPNWPSPIKAPQGAPNIVVILLDDTGFGASSTFGGPARTPELDKLAAQGLRYNRFHVTALCSPTRAALLSGRNDHVAGFGTVVNAANGYPGYNGIWKKNTVLFAEVLRRNGYSTAAFGKWHNTPYWEINPVGPFDRWPTGLGFEYFYGEMQGLGSQWNPVLYRNTSPVSPKTDRTEHYHFTSDIVDDAINWIHTHQSLAPDKPYFLYLATNATHAPFQVPRAWVEKYRGQFSAGWDRLREETYKRQKKLGIIPPEAALTPRPQEIPAWDSLTTQQKQLAQRQMEVFAAYLSHTDHEIGRLLKTVRQGPSGDNTLVFYIVGDNGGDLEAGPIPPFYAKVAHLGVADLDMGGEEDPIGVAYGAGWGWATNTPFQWGKFVASHLGGTRDPLVVSWPERIKNFGGVRTQYTHVNDVAATIYDVTGISVPGIVDGVQQLPLDGNSFAYSFDDAAAPSTHRTQIFEQSGNRSIYHDGWIAAARHGVPWDHRKKGDFENDRWELYHLDVDYSEAHDLAAENLQKLRELQALFDEEARRNNIYPLLEYGSMDPDSAPSLARNRREFIYYPGLPRIPENLDPRLGAALPDFTRSHRITAELQIPEHGAQGVLVADGGGFFGGFALYVLDDYLVFESRNIDHTIIRSRTRLPRGRVAVAYEFTSEKVTGSSDQDETPGTGRLYIDGRLAAQMKVRATASYAGGSFGIGQAFNLAGFDIKPPFKFTGILERVTVEMK